MLAMTTLRRYGWKQAKLRQAENQAAVVPPCGAECFDIGLQDLTLNLVFGLASVTSCGYDVTMIKGVRVADLKSRLSEHLRKVRAGRTVTVMDRSTPIARIVPYDEQGGGLAVRSPLPGALSLAQIPLPPPLRLNRDVVTFLLEERQGER